MEKQPTRLKFTPKITPDPQLSDFQTKGICANHEELDLQRSSISKEEQQEDFISLYLPITSNIDKKYNNDEEYHANVFSNHPFYDECESDPGMKRNDKHSSEISHLQLVADIKQYNLNRVEDFIYCSLIALSHGVLKIEDTHLQSFVFEQHEGIILHEFHDPMASWMEFYFSKVSNAPSFARFWHTSYFQS